MTEPNFLASNVTIENILEEDLLNTKGEYMKEELITHADSVTNN